MAAPSGDGWFDWAFASGATDIVTVCGDAYTRVGDRDGVVGSAEGEDEAATAFDFAAANSTP